MAGQAKIAQRVIEVVQEPVASLGFELVDVEWVRDKDRKVLRLIIDKVGGVNIDDCTAVSRRVDPLIDEHLKSIQHDYLEVSSPGLDRPLKTDRDLTRYCGERVELNLYRAVNGAKKITGRLGPFTEQTIHIDMDDGAYMDVERNLIAKIKRTIEF